MAGSFRTSYIIGKNSLYSLKLDFLILLPPDVFRKLPRFFTYLGEILYVFLIME
jgi:hypothetical protein